MNLTIEIPDDRVARFRKIAEDRGLASCVFAAPKPTLAEVFAKVRGMADDVDFSRDPSPGRDVEL